MRRDALDALDALDVFFCDLLLNRRTATWNLSVLYNKETQNMLMA